VKAVVGGTTAIQGSAKMAYPYEGWLVRNVEYETFKTGKKTVYQSALPLKNADAYRLNRERMKNGNAFVYHLSEGTDPVLIDEYELARSRRILRPRFCGIHCTALGEPQFEEWEQIAEDIDAAEDVEGARTARSSVALLESVALPRHHRCRRGQGQGHARLPRLGLVAVRL
jgi:hypothetical protein